MKKLVLYLSIVALAVGCAKEDNNTTSTDNALSFKSFVDMPSKAASNDNTALEQDFGVFAYLDAAGDHNATNLKADFMLNQHVVYANKVFTYTPVKYWPNTGDVDFYAYTPFSSPNMANLKPTDATTIGYPTFDYTVATNITAQEDLLIAGLEDQDGATVSSVNLIFDHALTKVAFAAKTHADYAATGATIKVTGLSLAKILHKGAFSYDNYMNMTRNTTWWTPTTDRVGYTPNLAVQDGVEVEYKYKDQPDGSYKIVNGEDQYLLLMPQTFATGGAQLTVNYSVTYGTGTPETFSKTFDLLNTQDWTPGLFITYAIDISLNTVTFTATVNKWTEFEQDFIIVPEDNE